MAKSWLVDGRTIARKVKTSGLPSAHQIKDCGATRDCPKCHSRIDNTDVSAEWPGLPVGVKFEPTDVELLGHLTAKCGLGDEAPHQFIDEFIPTLDMNAGICYKHPEDLPGATKDGSIVHFFYKTRNAYNTGKRKRRKISKDSNLTKGVRWHKTGKTKAVKQNNVQIGCKKIMVLYGVAAGGKKAYKLNWVMHQYHLGTAEDEPEGQYVVSKVFYQAQKQNEKVDDQDENGESDAWLNTTSPKTPNAAAPDPPRPGKSIAYDDVTPDNSLHSKAQGSGLSVEQKYLPSSSNAESKDNTELPIWEDDSQAVDLDSFDDSLFCNENLDTGFPLVDSRLNYGTQRGSNLNTDGAPGASRGESSGFADLENMDLGTPPDFNLADLPFSSQDSIFGFLERF